MYDDKVTCGDTSDDNEEGYASSSSSSDDVAREGYASSSSSSDDVAREGYASPIDYCYSEEEKYEDKTERLSEDISASTLLHELSLVAQGVDALKLSKPPKDLWMKTWPKGSNNILVNVYGYFNEDRCFAGHAVIVRDMSTAMPIAASAKFTQYGISYLHHVLIGLMDGLDLASKHGCSSPTVLCNSRLVVQLLRKVASDFCRCNSNKTVSTVCEICTSECFPHLDKVYFRNLVPCIEMLQKQRGSATFEWDSGKNKAVQYLARLVKMNSLYHRYPSYTHLMEEPDDFPAELVDILWKDAYGTDYYNLGERIEMEMQYFRARNNMSGDIRDGNTNVVEANGSNSNITSNAGTEVVLSTREEVTASAKGVKSMAEKGQRGDDLVNSSVGDKKAISAGNSIANVNVVVSAKGQTSTVGHKVITTSLEEMKDGKAEASADSFGTEGWNRWITVKRKKKGNKKSL